ncbi:MAG: transglycosylase SLT domain-containing protein [Bdellovibrionales bacterium]|nr:transglycosylase SLT domain-containing protein [Bdellovibrionales bacterium]
MSFFIDLAKSTFRRLVKRGVDIVFRESSKKPKKNEKPSTDQEKQVSNKNHPWRLCPTGESWVRTHPLTVPVSSEGPRRKTTRHGHCRINAGKSEIYTADELKDIAESHFDKLIQDTELMPIPDSMGFQNGNNYDHLIAGWTKFWNEILNPKTPLTPDFVKALIATESSFETPKDRNSSDGSARGLIQVTDNTRKALKDLKGELRNHYIELSVEESREPTTNIAAGIRWLHHKKKLAEHRLKREITWEEAGAEYKGIFPQIGKNKTADGIMRKLREYHGRLQNQRK